MPRLHAFLCIATFAFLTSAGFGEPVAIFDGKTFAGWEGDTGTTWRIEDGAVVAGTLEKMQPHNEFLCTVKEYGNFDLSLKRKLAGTEGFVNGGVQFRTKCLPNNFEVSGYQADLGAGYDGVLYDESRRGILVKPSKEDQAKAMRPLGEWNDYRIRAEGPHIEIRLNGVKTVDFTEKDAAIPASGIIGLQIHGKAKSVVYYKDLVIEELPSTSKTAPGGTVAPQARNGGAS